MNSSVRSDLAIESAEMFNKTEKLFFGIFGDLAFFYDMNVLGNRHIDNNVRLMVVNNGVGVEFKFYHHQSDFLDMGQNQRFLWWNC